MDIGGIEIIDTGSRLLTAEEVAELTEHIEQLQAANHEMWVRMTHMELHECPDCANVADLQEALEENAKLRELLHVLCYCMHESTDCDGCKLNDGSGEMELDAFWACDGLHERLRELGIEVSDG